MAHWKASHHIEGVPHVDGAQCSEALADAVDFLEAALKRAAEDYERRALGNEPGGLVVSDGFARHERSWDQARGIALEGIDRLGPHFAQMNGTDADEWAQIEAGSCVEVLGVNYVIEGCTGHRCQVKPEWVTLYHRTSEERAGQIRAERAFTSRERPGFVYFSDRPDGAYAAGYGSAVVAVTVPAGMALPEDEFDDGERHFRVEASKIRPEWVHMTVPGGA